MNRRVTERLYHLLPSIIRARDAEEGEALRALMAILQTHVDAVTADIDQLYDDAFIETCQEQFIPYIGDLVKARGLISADGQTVKPRAYVANTVRYRRRKGTAPMIEQLVRDVTGWPARVVEGFQRLITCQNLNHRRMSALATPSIRDANRAQLLDGALGDATHTVDIRSLERGWGRFNVPNIWISAWRLRRFELEKAQGLATDSNRTTFSLCPIRSSLTSSQGVDLTLLNRAETETDITHLAEEVNLPVLLRKRALDAERREGTTDSAHYFAATNPVVAFYLALPGSSSLTVVAPDTIQIGTHDAAGWQRPTGSNVLVFDPERGRVAIGNPNEGTAEEDEDARDLYVTYGYGAPAELGSGPYDRSSDLDSVFDETPTWHAAVSALGETAPDGVTVFATLALAIAAWNTTYGSATTPVIGLIVFLDNARYNEGALTITLPPDAKLVITAGVLTEWGTVTPRSVRPCVDTVLTVSASLEDPFPATSDRAALILDGLMINGRVIVDPTGDLGELVIQHCTVVAAMAPTTPALSVAGGNELLTVEIKRALMAGISLSAIGGLTVTDTMLDAAGAVALAAEGVDVTINTSTVQGNFSARTLQASECIFTEELDVARRQDGCVRYSFVPSGSRTPRRFQCQPDLALERASSAERAGVLRAMVPVFMGRAWIDSTGRLDPNFLRLARRCPEEIRTGAEDGAEMGVFHHLGDAHKESNLRAALEEYIRFGCVAGITYVT